MKSCDAVVTKLCVARLFNLGNYEHERIEVTVEARGTEAHDGSHIPDNILNPEIVLADLRHFLECCKPAEKTWQACQGEEIESGSLLVWDGSGTQPDGPWVGAVAAKEFIAAFAHYKAETAKREAGLLRLRSLGQVTVNGGAS